jgi:hypothetical protein
MTKGCELLQTPSQYRPAHIMGRVHLVRKGLTPVLIA